MKGLKIALIGILTVLALCLTAVLIYCLPGGGKKLGWEWKSGGPFCTLQNTRELDVTDVSQLKVDFSKTGCDIIFCETEGEALILEEYFSYKAKEEEYAALEKTGGVVSIRRDKDRNFFGGWKREYVKLYVPGALFEQLDTLEVESGSGDVQAELLRAAAGSISASSGDVEIEVCEGDFTLSTASGDINIGSCSGNLQVNSSSGDQEIGSCRGNLQTSASSGDTEIGLCQGNLSASAGSGDIQVGDAGGAAQIETGSGDISLGVTTLGGDMYLRGSSGDAKLQLPQDCAFSFEARTTSGSIQTSFDQALSFNDKGNWAEGSVGESPQYSVSCSFASGDVRVIK